MHRLLIGLAIAVGVVAIGAVVAVALLNPDDTDTSSQDAQAPDDAYGGAKRAMAHIQAAKDEESAPVESAAREDMAPTAEAPPEDEPGEPPAAKDEGGDTSDRVATIIDSLSSEDEQALFRELQHRRMRRWREAQQYRLPSGGRLYALQWHDQGKHKLNETQKARIAEFDEMMKPKIEAALQATWNQEADIRQQISDLHADGRREEAQTLYQDMGKLRQEIESAKNELDVEYKEMLRGVLTAEQMEFVESSSGMRYRTWVGQPPASQESRSR